MDAISELDVIQKLADTLEQSKKDFVELVFPLDNRNVYGLFCKLVSYCISMKYTNTLRKCARVVKVGTPSYYFSYSYNQFINTSYDTHQSQGSIGRALACGLGGPSSIPYQSL